MKDKAEVGQVRKVRLTGQSATAWQVCYAPQHVQRVTGSQGVVHYETPTLRAACTIDAWLSWDEVKPEQVPKFNLIAYLADDVVRISPRWVVWLEAGLIIAAITAGIRRIL
jgi:hypothetical protein